MATVKVVSPETYTNATKFVVVAVQRYGVDRALSRAKAMELAYQRPPLWLHLALDMLRKRQSVPTARRSLRA